MRVVLALLLLVGAELRARADDAPLQLEEPVVCTVPGRAPVTLPAGVLLPAQTWARLDAEVRKREDDAHRLTAENQSLRDHAGDSVLSAVVLTGGAAVLAGFLIGALVFRHTQEIPP
jgi:hypothetical protein